MKWLFNFSASPAGGGLRRLEETAKWFDRHGGATFLVHAEAMGAVSRYAGCNRYISVRQNKLARLIADGRYLPKVIQEIGTPDVYFSYGIPLFFEVGMLNWIHVSNALTLTHDRHGMPFKRHCELRILGRRMVRSLKHAQIASAESEYALDLFRMDKGNPGGERLYVVIDNGCEESLFDRPRGSGRGEHGKYAITVGTAPYKRLGQALTVFDALQQRSPDLLRFKIVGDRSQIPRRVLEDTRVEALGSGIGNEDLYAMIEGSEYYISTSGIENSSVAVAEALLLAPNLVLSDIPSHREAVRAIAQTHFSIPGEGIFIEVRRATRNGQGRPPSWSDVLQRISDTVSEVSNAKMGGQFR